MATADSMATAEPAVAADSAVAVPVEDSPTEEVTAPAGPDTVSTAEAKEENVLELEKDVVVGYGTMKKEDLTGSVVSVKADDLVKDAAYSVLKSLQGRAAGVNITQNSGAPGKSITVRVRGVGTINNPDPLFVVDGVPVSNLDFLNPDDIESATILKDASACAIYGSRGANGVFLVTTKKAQESRNRVRFNTYIGTQQPWRKPSLCNAEQWAILNNEALRAANKPVNDELNDPASLGEGTNWFDQILNDNPLIHQQSVSVERGTDKLKYYFSGGLFHQEGIIKGSELDKVTLRLNTHNQIAPWISIGEDFGIAHFNTDFIDESDEWNSLLVNTLAMDPVTKPGKNDSGNYVPSKFNNAKNPLGIIENTNITGKKISYAGVFYSNINIFNTLNFNTTFSLNGILNDSTNFYPKYYISPSDRNDYATITRKTRTDNTWQFENTVTYKRDFLEDHSIKLMVAGSAQDRRWDSVYVQGQNTPSNDSSQWVIDAADPQGFNAKGRFGGNSLLSGLGRLEYNYADRYLLTSSFRSDASSRFAEKNRWGYFPSAAGAWKISQEPFMSRLTFIEGLKLRAGWGVTGNQEIPDYQYTTNTSNKQDYPFGNTINPGTTLLSSGNSEIHWEDVVSSNIGLDFTILDGRIEFLSDFYDKTTNGMLIQPPIPAMAGRKVSPMTNGGSIQNRGMELVLNYQETVGDFFSNLGVNFSAYRNEVLDLGALGSIEDGAFLNSGFVTKTEVGHPIGAFYGYKTDGLFQNWDEINSFTYTDKDGQKKLVQPNAQPGDVKYLDENEDGEKDKGYIGSPHPDVIIGLGADAAYKGFDLNFSFVGIFGNEIFNGTRWYTENGTGYFNLDQRILDRWTGEGSTNDVNLPRMSENASDNRLISDRYIEDGSYVRLKTMQLGYTLNESLARRLLVKKCRFYIGAENLLTFTRYTGLDPEVGLTEARTGTKNSALTIGLDRTTYPQARTYMAGLNITL
jgi:TonB-linked SusC/RagA family outer membrane protein